MADSGAHVRLGHEVAFPHGTNLEVNILKGELKSYGSTIIKRQSSKAEREGTFDSGQLRSGADRPSGPNAVWNKQF
jgi:hypothetical protein